MGQGNQDVWFVDEGSFDDTGRPGFRRRVIDAEGMTIWFWRIAGGATGSYLHQHPNHEQFGLIVRGGLDFRIGEGDEPTERTVLRPGDIYFARPGVWHGDSIFIGDDEYDECWIIDVFAPRRVGAPGEEVAHG